MNQEKIWKIAKGLRKFTFDDILIISELEESELQTCLDNIIKSKKIVKYYEKVFSIVEETNIAVKIKANNVKTVDITFKKAANRYLKDQGIRKFGSSTLKYYDSYLRNHILPYFGKLRLNQVTPEVINDFIQLKISEDISNKSINNYLTLIGSILEKAIEDGLLEYNPICKVNKLDKIPSDKRILTVEEVELLLKTAKAHYPDFHPLLYTAIKTRMRRCELLGLTWNKVDFASQKIKVDQILIRKKIIPHSMPALDREIDISEELFQVLSDWRNVCPKGYFDLVFPNSIGKPQSPDNMTERRFNPLLEKAKLCNISFKDLTNQRNYN